MKSPTGRLGQHAALADDNDLLDCLSDLCEHVAREQHRAAGGREVAQRVTEPADAVGVEPVGRLVEDEDLGLAEQRACEAEALAHALRETADAALGRVREADLFEHLEDARSRNAHRASQNREMTDRRTSGMPDMSVEQGADEAAGVGQVAVAGGAEERRARRGLDEPEQCAERRRLAGAVRAEEADDRAALHREADVQDGLVIAVGLRELVDGDDGVGVARSRERVSCESPFGVAWMGRAPASRVRGRGRWT